MITLTDLLNGKRDGISTLFFATTPSLRATSPQGEAFCLRGAVVETTEGVSKIRIKGRPMIAPTKKVCVVS